MKKITRKKHLEMKLQDGFKKYDGTNWIYANTSEEWYNYTNKQWANAVVVKENKKCNYSR